MVNPRGVVNFRLLFYAVRPDSGHAATHYYGGNGND